MPARKSWRLIGMGVVIAALLMPTISRSGSPGSNGWIAFADEVAFPGGSTSTEIVLLDPRTGERRNLTNSGLFQGDPAWSPDGRRLAYSGEAYIAALTIRSGPTMLVQRFVEAGETFYPWGPSWSPDVSRLAFAVYDELGRTGIGVTRIGGKPRLLVAPTQNLTMDPQWSPDGRWIAFERYGGQTDGVNYVQADVMVVRAAGGDPRNLTLDTLKDHRPTWTPDGDLMFVSRRGCGPGSVQACEDVYVMEPDGSSVRRLTTGPHDWGNDGEIDRIGQAEMSPDGRFLLISTNPRAFTDYDAATAELWRVDVATGAKTRLLDAFSFWFDWQPRCEVIGSKGDDTLLGGRGSDLMCGLGGNDVIKGRGGDDVIFGHGDDDEIVGGTGRDIVVGNAGRDRCDRDERDHSRIC